MTAQGRFREADVKRAAAGVVRAGIPIARIEIDRAGNIVIIPGQPNPAKGSNDWADHE